MNKSSNEGRIGRRYATLFFLGFAAAVTLFGCATNRPPPPGLPVVFHDGHGLTFFFPADWQGYTAVMEQWHANEGKQHGPTIVLRNPKWTPEHPTQDIPIWVFTRDQWTVSHLENGFSISAGGVDEEISHNNKYVFVISSRFSWGELPGWKEASEAVQKNSTLNQPHLYPE